MTWSIHTLGGFCRCFTDSCQICNRTNICWVGIENPRISLIIWGSLTSIQRISVWSQIWKREVEERLKLHNLGIHHNLMHWDLRYWIAAKVAWTIQWNCGAGTTWPKIRGFTSGRSNYPTKTMLVRVLAAFGTEPNRTAGQNPHRCRVTSTSCYYYVGQYAGRRCKNGSEQWPRDYVYRMRSLSIPDNEFSSPLLFWYPDNCSWWVYYLYRSHWTNHHGYNAHSVIVIWEYDEWEEIWATFQISELVECRQSKLRHRATDYQY